MKESIGYCGYNCHLCAARSEDREIRQQLVDGWKALFGHENYTAENVKCDGCRSNGTVADTHCVARPCAREKGLESCALCDEFPCKKVRHLMATGSGMLVHCYPRTAEITKEVYDLCMRQFDSIPNLIEIMKDAGKLPTWAGE